MARPLRIEYINACYHVSNSGEYGDRIFPGPKYYTAFLECLHEASTRLNVEILGYCLLSNEYHLLIKTPEGNLSRFMRQVDGMYTQTYQNLKNLAGPVFRARYKSVLIQPDNYLLKVSRYIHALPRKNKIKPQSHTWSSLAAYSNKAKSPPWLSKDEVLGSLPAGSRPAARYAAFVAEGVDEELAHFYGKKNLLSILGDNKFLKRSRIKQTSDTERGKSRGPLAKLRPSISKVVVGVAKHYKVSEKSIYKAARGPGSKNIPRWVAMYLCQELSGVTLQEIAKRFGLKRYGTVSTTIGKLKQEFQITPKTVIAVKKLRTQLAP
jgi:putative transposase